MKPSNQRLTLYQWWVLAGVTVIVLAQALQVGLLWSLANSVFRMIGR